MWLRIAYLINTNHHSPVCAQNTMLTITNHFQRSDCSTLNYLDEGNATLGPTSPDPSTNNNLLTQSPDTLVLPTLHVCDLLPLPELHDLRLAFRLDCALPSSGGRDDAEGRMIRWLPVSDSGGKAKKRSGRKSCHRLFLLCGRWISDSSDFLSRCSIYMDRIRNMVF